MAENKPYFYPPGHPKLAGKDILGRTLKPENVKKVIAQLQGAIDEKERKIVEAKNRLKKLAADPSNAAKIKQYTESIEAFVSEGLRKSSNFTRNSCVRLNRMADKHRGCGKSTVTGITRAGIKTNGR